MPASADVVTLPADVLRELLGEIDHFSRYQDLCFCALPQFFCPPCSAYRIATLALKELPPADPRPAPIPAGHGVCPLCRWSYRLKRSGRVGAHLQRPGVPCDGNDMLPVTDAARLALLEVLIAHRPDEFARCLICSPDAPPAWPCPIWKQCDEQWKASGGAEASI